MHPMWSWMLPWLLWHLVLLAFQPAAGHFQLQILHNNDMHARFEETSAASGQCLKVPECFGGIARVAHEVMQARLQHQQGTGPAVLYLNAGDTFQGTVWFTVHKWKIAADAMNYLRPDAMCYGNHEFDDGAENLVPFTRALQFPLVSSNTDFSKDPSYENLQVNASVVLDVDGHKIGIIGYVTPDTTFLAKPGEVVFEDEIEAINRESEKLERSGVKIVIALGHSGYKRDLAIAKACPLVDVVVGGHTNTFLWNGVAPSTEKVEGPYPAVVKQKSGKKVPVVQAYAFTKYLGVLNITFDDAGNVLEFGGQPKLLSAGIPQDQAGLQLIEKYRPEIDKVEKEIVGTTKVALLSSDCRLKECGLGSLLADALIDYQVRHYNGRYWTNAPIALVNGGSIRNSVELQNISRATLLSVFPFVTVSKLVTIKGETLKEVLEWSVHSDGETSRGEFLQLAGIKMLVDQSRPPGSRVVEALVKCAFCEVPKYEPIRPQQNYTILTDAFIVGGGDNYNMLHEKALSVEDSDEVSEILAQYLQKHSPIYLGIEDRIRFVSHSAAPRLGAAWLLLVVLSFGLVRFL